MKKVLGLDLGTNSIGWALINEGSNDEKSSIEGLGSRIIPMSQDVMGNFDKGNSISQTAERTRLRGVRRLRERQLLRRERLHRVLNIIGYLPKHYSKSIDFEKHFGQFRPDEEPKLAYKYNDITQMNEFIFHTSFSEMLEDFKLHQPNLLSDGKKIPYDWTIYYLRKKALTKKIDKEEFAWLLLHFNQKRGYYQLRGEDEDDKQTKKEEYYSLKVVDVTAENGSKVKRDEIWYSILLENGWIYRRTSKTPLDWVGKVKDFIVTTDYDENGEVKKDKEGKEKRSFRAPLEEDWTLVKKKTEADLSKSNKSVGSYIYDTLLQNPNQKIRGQLVRTIERKFYKEELRAILTKQKEFHIELRDNTLYTECIASLYSNNDAHRNNVSNRDFTYLFLDDIIFYQRPLKSKKSLISNCPYETRTFLRNGEKQIEALKCIAKSNPLFQEFRLWQFLKNLKIYAREKLVDGRLCTDVNVTDEFLKTDEDWTNLFEWLNDRKEIKQDTLLSSYFKIKKAKGEDKLPFRWNYVEDKEYPCNETHAQIISRLNKCSIASNDILSFEKEMELWHILYSVEDKIEVEKALKTFATKNNLTGEFYDQFKSFPPFKKEYGAYSEKAIKKLLPLMRRGKYWNEDNIHPQTIERINKIINGEYDEKIKTRIHLELESYNNINNFVNLPLWLVCYIVYDRHAESGDVQKWHTPTDIERFLKEDFKQHSLRNPIVEKVIAETLRVVKDIWIQYGNGDRNFFKEIHIELGREMKNPADKRKQMTQQISDNENTNLRIKSLLIEMLNDNEVENVRPYSPSQQEILKLYEEGILNSEIEIPDDILKISKQNQPSKSELVRYKLWLDQKYRSPYTNEVIPLSKLFTSAYEIEHIIPKARYFDDSFSNKVICEAEVNTDKGSYTAFEYIKANGGKIIDLNFGKKVKLLRLESYEDYVKNNFSKNRSKMKKLLMEDIPDDFINRQLNDSRYISKVVKALLSNIVREEGEEEATSKNVLSTNGSITTTLKQDWGLNDVWNTIVTPRFVRLNQLSNSTNFGEWINKGGNRVFQTNMPLELQKGFNKKRIDHRHHAMDALAIACATRNHINYLNNESAKASKNETRHELKNLLCFKQKTDDKGNYKWIFKKPWETFTQDSKTSLEKIIVSFQQNLRVINRTRNTYQKWGLEADGTKKKRNENQKEKINWAIRKPIHKDTVGGLVNLRFKQTVSLSLAIDKKEFIVNKELKAQIKELLAQGNDKKKIVEYFKKQDYKLNAIDISKPEIYYFDNENIASRVKIDDSFDEKKIKSITDHGIQKILLNHLNSDKYQNQKDESGKVIVPSTLAFSADGIDELNKNITTLNNGRFHQPIYKVRTFEPKGNKFAVGVTGNKKDKYVETAKGTNLYFAVYVDEEGKRIYESIPLNIVIERQKQETSPVPEINEKGARLLFYLSPNDLVYVPSIDEIDNPSLVNWNDLTELQNLKIYKMVSSSGTQVFFNQAIVASPIVNKVEFSALNKMEKSVDGIMIKDVCWKLSVDRLGFIRKIAK